MEGEDSIAGSSCSGSDVVVSLFPPRRQIECMVAMEMMQRYKKLQFERGESSLFGPLQGKPVVAQKKDRRHISPSISSAGVSASANRPQAAPVSAPSSSSVRKGHQAAHS